MVFQCRVRLCADWDNSKRDHTYVKWVKAEKDDAHTESTQAGYILICYDSQNVDRLHRFSLTLSWFCICGVSFCIEWVRMESQSILFLTSSWFSKCWVSLCIQWVHMESSLYYFHIDWVNLVYSKLVNSKRDNTYTKSTRSKTMHKLSQRQAWCFRNS